MTKPQLIHWLQANRPFLNIAAIGRAAGVRNLGNILSGNKNGRGEELQLADKHVEPLSTIVEEIRENRLPSATTHEEADALLHQWSKEKHPGLYPKNP